MIAPVVVPAVNVAHEQRAYHVHMALLSAESAFRIAHQRAHDALDAEIDGRETPSGRFGLYHRAAEAREWKGIAAACRREENRLARLKHGGAQ